MVSLLALLVLAQTTQASNTVLLTANGNNSEVSFNRTTCNNVMTVTWASTVVGIPCTPLTLWSTTGTCGDAAAAGDIRYADVSQAQLVASPRTATFDVRVSELPGFSSTDAGIVCGSEGVDATQYVCGAVKVSSVDCSNSIYVPTVLHARTVTVKYDTKAPTPPELGPFDQLDGELSAAFTVSSDTVKVHAFLAGPDDAQFVEYATVADSATHVRISGLTNGATYSAYLTAEDAAQNVSEASNVQQGTPIDTFGFWDSYRRSGGASQGGCASSGLELSGLAALAAAASAVRRKHR